MKKTLLILLLPIAVFTSQKSNAQAFLIHYWHFNQYTTANVHLNNLKADFSLLDTNKAIIKLQPYMGTVADTGYIDNYTPTAQALDTPNINKNAQMGAPAGTSIRVRNPSDSMEMRFYIPTKGYQNIVLKYMSESSSASSGQKVQLYDYSIDSGTTWRTTGLTKTSDTTDPATYKLVTVPFSDVLDTSVKNNNKLVFRIKFSGQNTGTSGNNRFDNVTVQGDTLTVIPPSTGIAQIAVKAASYSLYPNPANNSITIVSDADREKQIVVVNSYGQKLYAATFNGATKHIDVSRMPAGLYFVQINNGVNTQVLRFIKQ